jgi:hypothetical protein
MAMREAELPALDDRSSALDVVTELLPRAGDQMIVLGRGR